MLLTRTYSGFFVVGTLLMLCAVVLLVQADAANPDRRAYQQMQVAEVVSQLQDCDLCHVASSDSAWVVFPKTALLAEHTMIMLPNVTEPRPGHMAATMVAEPPTAQNIQIEALLLDLGQRILDLPERPGNQAEAVTDHFLQAYDTVRTGTEDDHAVGTSTLDLLSDLAQRMRDLESQAQPEQWTVPDMLQVQVVPAALHTLPAPPSAVALDTALLTLDGVLEGQVLSAEYAVFMPLQVTGMAYRRGPPADMVLDSVLYRRLHL